VYFALVDTERERLGAAQRSLAQLIQWVARRPPNCLKVASLRDRGKVYRRDFAAVTITAAGLTEVSAQECQTAWLVLLTLEHAALDQPIRVTSDAVTTISNGNTYSPFPFEVTLPDDVEGRAPQARLRIDNTSQEIVAMLRGLTSPLKIQIVRSAAPDVVEREWLGLEWRVSQYDIGAITGILTIDDMALEEFPCVTFDGRFTGLWP
jgi:Domain of unknown function (DUF1833)